MRRHVVRSGSHTYLCHHLDLLLEALHLGAFLCLQCLERLQLSLQLLLSARLL